MRLAVFQPDIPQNLGAALRLAACMGIKLEIIEPCGFPLSDRAVQRAAMDYAQAADTRRHELWATFMANWGPGRLLLLTTRGSVPYYSFQFAPDDVLLLGRESAGVPEEVHAAADERLLVPMVRGARSLNVVVSAAMVLGEALRQLDGFPD